MKKYQQTNLAAILCALITILILYQCAPILQSATAATECGCPECPCAEKEIVPLYGAELYKALSEALQNQDVKILRNAFTEDGYTPIVPDVTAYEAVDEGFSVIIPFKGDCLYAAIYYGHTEDFEGAGAAIVYELGDEWVMDVYEVNEEGEVTVTELRDHSCTFGCVYDCLIWMGFSPLGAASCITACIGCLGGMLPACLLCGFCSGVVLGCADICCLH